MKRGLFKAIVSFISLSVVVFSVSLAFIYKNNLIIGIVLLFLGFLGFVLLKIFKIKIKSTYPDILFGMIDNGILVFTAVLGSLIAGIPGAILGGVAGNTITDGVGGIFEGHLAEKQREKNIKTERTALSSCLGKMTGCLIGAGVGLIIVGLINLI